MQADTTISLELEDCTLELEATELEDATLELEATELEDATLELEATELEDATLELEATTSPQDVSTHHQVWLASSLIHCGTPSLTRFGFMV
jgi:hypothetical protein